MKITLITHHFLPNYGAGAEQYAYRVAQGLRRRGHTIEVICIESITEGSLTPICTSDIYEDLLVHRLHFDIRKAPNRFKWSYRNLALGEWLERFLHTTHPDVVHVNSGYLLGGTVPEAAFGLNIPTVLTMHDYWFMCPLVTLLRTDGRVCSRPVPPARCVWCSLSQKRRYRLLDRQLSNRLGDAFVRMSKSETVTDILGVASDVELVVERRRYLKQILERFDAVISPSRFMIQKIGEYGYRPRQMIYLPFGLNNTPLSSPGPSTLSTKLHIGYLGQFWPHKGVHLLLPAFQMLARQRRACELLLYGDISDASSYERELLQIARGDPAITFAGPYPNRRVGQILSGLDAIVAPSIWYENRPTVILEAHATQTPVVTARLGGMAELIKHNQNGLLFEPGSVDSLREQLQRLVDEPTLLSHLRSGIGPVPSVEEETSRLVSLYKSLLSAPRRATSSGDRHS